MTAMQPHRGFTLVELMISIAIVAVMFGVIINSVFGVRRNGRDAQRQADLRTIQSALQNFYTDQNYFPNNAGSTTSTDISTLSSITNCTGAPTSPACTISTTYLSPLPADPLSSVSYKYKPKLDASSGSAGTTCNTSSNTNSCHYYILCAVLENPSPQNSTQYAECNNSTNGFGSVSGYGSTNTYQVNP